jgi:DNA topoisomerase-3
LSRDKYYDIIRNIPGRRRSNALGQIVIFAEKPDIGTRLAATLGGCYINGTELKPEMISNKKYEGIIKKERSSKGYLTSKYKGRDYVITWGFGHIGELKQAPDYDARYKVWLEDLFPFIPQRYEYKIKESENIKKHFELVKKLFNDPSTEYVINACDSDREGQLIGDIVYQLAGCRKPYKRLWINSYTEEAIYEGMDSLKDEREVRSLQEAGRARAIADWLTGANFTAMATIKFGGYKNMVSIGRVQTPTLALLVNRELEIQSFKPEPYFELVATFETTKHETYKGKWAKNKVDRFQTRQEAEAVLKRVNGRNGVIVEYEEKTSEEKPPLLFDLTSLQMSANSLYGFSAQKTLDIVQKLYENQLLTYPRTNSRYLSNDMKKEIKRIIKALPDRYNPFRDNLVNQQLSYTSRVFNDSKIESHHAIIPTYKSPGNMMPDEEKIYDLVAKSLLKAFLPNAVWGTVKAVTEVNGELFHSSGKTLIEEGWRAVDGKKTASDDEEQQLLPAMKKGDNVAGKSYEVLEKKTKAPSRYTEKTLLSTMETAGKLVEDEELREAMKVHGLGTPATRAAIIERLIQVGYVTREKKNLVPTDKGMEIIRILPIEEVKSPSLTGEWEYKLNQIEKGKKNYNEFLNEIEEFTKTTVEKLKGQKKQEIANDADGLGKCPVCGGTVVKNKKGWGCTNWKNGCKFQIWDNEICGKKLTLANIKQLLSKGETNLIKGFTSKAGKKFDAKLKLAENGNGKLEFLF